MRCRRQAFLQMWIRSLSRAAAFGLLAACLIGCGSSTNSNSPLQNALQKDITGYLTARSSLEHISTISMTVSVGNHQPDISVAAGTTQYGGGSAVTPANLFQIGSNTKAFTSVAILELEAAGVLSIDDTVGKWLPQYPQWSQATIRQLLNMTSGIPTYDATPAWETDYSNNPMIESTPAQLAAYVYPTVTAPGAWKYSNTGYILAQMIIDKASRSQSYQTEVRRIVTQVGLHNTYYAPYFYPPFVTRRLVSGYEVNYDDSGLSKLFNKDTSGFSLGWTQGAGGIISNPQDFTRWIRALFQGEVLPPKQMRELEGLVAIPSGQPISQTSASQPQGFALGIFQITDPKLGVFWAYQGSTLGYRATYDYFPSSGLIISIFTNSQTTDAQNKISAQLFPAVYATLKAAGRIR